MAFLKQLNRTIDRKPIEKLLSKFYHTGKSAEGGKAYPPLFLFKCLLLQKWFQIPSDPDLESQINDRISFKSFLALPIEQPAPDHSTFSRFRSRLSKSGMTKINSALLNQFHAHGLSVNQGVAIDARLIKSASRPISNDQINELKQKQDNDPNANLDKNGNLKNSSVTLNQTGWLKMMCRITESKNMQRSMLKTGLCYPQISRSVLTMTRPICHMRPLTAYTPMSRSKPFIPIKAMPELPIESFSLAINHIGDGIMRKTMSMPCSDNLPLICKKKGPRS